MLPNNKLLQKYLSKGWEKVEEEKPKKEKSTYENYTKKQLVDMCSNRNLIAKEYWTKKEIIEKLKKNDVSPKPSNKGFSDNLIKK